MTDDGPNREDLEDQVDELEERVLGGVEHQDRRDHAGCDERITEPAIEQDIGDDELAAGEATSEPAD